MDDGRESENPKLTQTDTRRIRTYRKLHTDSNLSSWLNQGPWGWEAVSIFISKFDMYLWTIFAFGYYFKMNLGK